MYEAFFGLTRKPFDLLPNPDFLYLSKSHKKAITYLDYAIQERSGFVLLTGEIGSGKTTLVREIIKKHRECIVFSKVFNTKVNAEQLIAMINEDFGLPVGKNEKIALLRQLNEFLIEQYEKGTKPLLVIDEAQNLSPETLEEVRLLSNLETDNGKLLHIILAGQPELRQTLASSQLQQLRQRVSFSCHLEPLSRDETGDYILHRLEVAGNRQAALFSPEAVEIVWQYSRGIPRVINIVCDYLLLTAMAEESKEISSALAREVVEELSADLQLWGEGALPGDGQEVITLTQTYEEQVRTSDAKIVELLKEIADRLDGLGHHDLPAVIEKVTTRLNEHDRRLRHFMDTVVQRLDRLQQEERNSISTLHDSPVDEGGGVRRKGLLGKLFRAV